MIITNISMFTVCNSSIHVESVCHFELYGLGLCLSLFIYKMGIMSVPAPGSCRLPEFTHVRLTDRCLVTLAVGLTTGTALTASFGPHNNP